MMTGPAVGPAMLLMVLMRWPSLVVIGAASVGGTFMYRELEHRYNLTEQIQTWYRVPGSTAVVVRTPGIGDSRLVKGTPALAGIEPAQVEPQQAMEELPVSSHPVQATFALSLEKEEKADANYSQRYVVQKGDNLTKIISRLRIPVQLHNDVMYSLVLENQRAFKNLDPNKLLEGSVLSIRKLTGKGGSGNSGSRISGGLASQSRSQDRIQEQGHDEENKTEPLRQLQSQSGHSATVWR